MPPVKAPGAPPPDRARRGSERHGVLSSLMSMSFNEETCGENAVTWALALTGSTAYATRCLAFVEDAVERSNDLEVFGGDFAAESARLYRVAADPGTPPAGAFVFYESVCELFGERRDWGHVGLSLGDGRVVHAWDRVRVDGHRDIEELTAPGGAPLRWIGWVPLSRVLEGARPRTWDEDAAAAAARMQDERFGS